MAWEPLPLVARICMTRRCLAGRVAVITGAARGIGSEIARAFLAEGCRVVALDRSWEASGLSNDRAMEERVSLQNLGALVESVDVTNAFDIQRSYDSTMNAFGTVDILVNNAAMRMRDVDPGRYAEIVNSDIDVWLRMLAVNVVGPVRMIKQFSVPMLAQGSGTIINISSASGSRGRAGDNPYGASKAALTNLSQSLAAELAKHGVSVNVVFPGVTQTTGYVEQEALGQDSRVIHNLPTLRPESVVPLVLWLANDQAEVTGETFAVLEWLLDHGFGPVERWLAAEAEADS